MPQIGELVALLRADISDLDKKLDKAEKHTKKTTRSMSKALDDIPWKRIGIAATAAFVAISVAMGKAISVASDLQEQTSKFETVFAGQLKKAEEFVEVLQTGFAQSEREAKQYLARIQDLLVPMGVASDLAGDMSFAITKLAADLGSFNNMPTALVMDNITSALVGETEAVRKYGIRLTQVNVIQKALTMGLAETKDELTAGHKALATYELIVQGSTFAIGDMARTQLDFANQLKAAKANVEDITGAIGTKLLPMASDLLVTFNKMAKEILENEEALQLIIETADMAARAFKFLGETALKTPGFIQKLLNMISDEVTILDDVEAAVEANAASFAGYEMEIAAAEAAMNKLLDAQQKVIDSKLVTDEEKKRGEIGGDMPEVDAAKIKAIEEALAMELEAIASADAQRIEMAEEVAEELARIKHEGLMIELKIEGDAFRKSAAVSAERAKNELIIAKSLQKLDRQMAMAKLNLSVAVGTALLTIAGVDGKKMFFLQKTIQVGMAVMAAFLASNLALATFPGPPYTIPLAAATLKLGLFNAAAVAATAIGQLAAGSSGGGGFGSVVSAGSSVTPSGASVSTGELPSIFDTDKDEDEDENVPPITQIIFQNPILDSDERVADIMEKINDLVENKGVELNATTAIELRE